MFALRLWTFVDELVTSSFSIEDNGAGTIPNQK